MASEPLFRIEDLLPKEAIKPRTIKATASLRGLLKVRVKNVPKEAILDGFKSAINKANARIAIDLRAALDDALRSSVWDTPSGRADIYETGELLSSGSIEFSDEGITIAYSAPYAALVHYGGYIYPYGNTSARVYLPPRPWVESVLNGGGPVEEFDFVRYYKEEIESEFG